LVAVGVRLVHGHDATELVKIRYNFAGVVLLIFDQSFRSFTGTADTSAPGANDAATCLTFRLRMPLALT